MEQKQNTEVNTLDSFIARHMVHEIKGQSQQSTPSKVSKKTPIHGA